MTILLYVVVVIGGLVAAGVLFVVALAIVTSDQTAEIARLNRILDRQNRK